MTTAVKSHIKYKKKLDNFLFLLFSSFFTKGCQNKNTVFFSITIILNWKMFMPSEFSKSIMACLDNYEATKNKIIQIGRAVLKL